MSLLPTVLVSDSVPANLRSQALALLRTTSDIGLLLGAAVTGEFAVLSSETLSMQTNAMALLISGAWFGISARLRKLSN